MLNGYFPSIFTKKHNNNSVLVSEQSKGLGISNELIHYWKRNEHGPWVVLLLFTLTPDLLGLFFERFRCGARCVLHSGRAAHCRQDGTSW